MNFFYLVFGHDGKSLNSLQMGLRAIVIFFITLVLIRIAGRRSFGLHTPFDNIIAILLGAILSRAVVGASAFIPTTFACLIIALLHRIIGSLMVFFPKIENFAEGNKILLFQNGRFLKKNLVRALVSEEDVREEARIHLNTTSLNHIDKIYIEKNGKVSLLKK